MATNVFPAKKARGKKIGRCGEGITTAAMSLHSGSPERGMRLPLPSGIRRGTGQKTGDRRSVDDRNLAFQLWLFKGIEDYKYVTNTLSGRDGFLSRGRSNLLTRGRFPLL
ncbi:MULTISPECIES: hypothetical protein [unclassified Brucella]|uniref:hypothetical protein n=1 Tax=unclassified Brucella TaxID=2632610 RepID=UPI0031B897E9